MIFAGVVLIVGIPGLVALHELSHAVAAWSMGLRVMAIVIGSGRRVLGFRVGGVDVEMNLVPWNGYIRHPVSLQTPVWRLAVVIAAGPGFHFILLLAFIIHGLLSHFTFSFAMWMIFYWNLTMLVGNLVPRRFHVNGLERRSDGKYLLDLFRKRDISFLLAGHQA